MRIISPILTVTLQLSFCHNKIGFAENNPYEFQSTYMEVNSILDNHLISNLSTDIKYGDFGCELLVANAKRLEDLIQPKAIYAAKINIDKFVELEGWRIDC